MCKKFGIRYEEVAFCFIIIECEACLNVIISIANKNRHRR